MSNEQTILLNMNMQGRGSHISGGANAPPTFGLTMTRQEHAPPTFSGVKGLGYMDVDKKCRSFQDLL